MCCLEKTCLRMFCWLRHLWHRGSLKDSGNLVYALILTAQVLHALHEQIEMLWIAENRGTASMAHVSNSPWAEDTVSSWVQTKSNWWLDWKRFLCLIEENQLNQPCPFNLFQGLHSLTCSPRSGRFGLLGQEKKRSKKTSKSDREVELTRFSAALRTALPPQEMLSQLACVCLSVPRSLDS